MTDLRDAAQQALKSLRGYRRELGCQQPCDAERALEAALEQPDRAQQQRDAGYTRRPTLREMAALEQQGQEEWAHIPDEFNDWWNADRLTQTNPFREDSPAYWAWEGWQARAALEQPEQEPVAWIQPDHLQKARRAPFSCRVEPTQRWADFVPLFTHPPRREWRGLKEWEINDGLDQLPTEDVCSWSFRKGVYFAEAALKERNA